MSEINTVNLIRLKAKHLKKENPSKSYCKLLDEITRQETNYKDYQDLKNRNKSKKDIKKQNNFHKIEQVISSEIGELLVGKIIHDSSIPDDNNEATIQGYDEPENIEILIDEAFHYGGNQFGIPFSLTINVATIFYIFKSDLYSIEESEMPSISDHNKHYFEADKEYIITVLGVVSATIEQDILNIKNISENISAIGISSIDRIKLLNSDN